MKKTVLAIAVAGWMTWVGAPLAPGAAAPTGRAASAATPAPAGDIDRLVLIRLQQLGLKPALLCSDAVFLRRAFLDVIGTLPTEAEARQFLLNNAPDKRQALIDRLLERPEFADYWAMKWSDLLRIKAEFPVNLWPNAAQAYYTWIHAAIAANKPYDQLARELLTSSGSNFRNGPVNFYRAMPSRKPESLAQAVALTFMGSRFEKWPPEQRAGMAGFFSYVGYKYTGEWKEEIVYFDLAKAGAAFGTHSSRPGAATKPAIFPDGTAVTLTPDRDPREVFADWLISPHNPWFARAAVNRIWFWLLGRGIVDEADDIRPDNPPNNPELLAYLQQQFVAAHYDTKQIYRLILNSQTYQRATALAGDRPENTANFASYPLRRVEAEVLMDALCQITGTNEKYSSPIPEPFTFIPEYHRSITLPDGSITSSFLETFGRSPRETGLLTERNDRPTAAQRLYLLNSSHVLSKVEQGRKLQALLPPRNPPRFVVDDLYLTILSRFPTDEERDTALTHIQNAANRRDAAVDVAWALINGAEFSYRH